MLLANFVRLQMAEQDVTQTSVLVSDLLEFIRPFLSQCVKLTPIELPNSWRGQWAILLFLRGQIYLRPAILNKKCEQFVMMMSFDLKNYCQVYQICRRARCNIPAVAGQASPPHTRAGQRSPRSAADPSDCQPIGIQASPETAGQQSADAPDPFIYPPVTVTPIG